MRVAFYVLGLGILILVVISAVTLVVKRRSKRSHARSVGGIRTRQDLSDHTELVQEVSSEMPDPKPVEAHLEIDYKDGNGPWTKRFVRVKEIDNNLDGGILIGHCELRGGTRAFRLDRIMQCVDMETGEAVQNVQKYLNDIYLRSSGSSEEFPGSDENEAREKAATAS